MQIEELAIPGVYQIELNPISDHRGFFMRTWDKSTFQNFDIHRDWVQENHSSNREKGVIRGLHFQYPPYSETKLVRCIQGEILDVFVDLRANSPTFGNFSSIVLSAENKKMVFIPRGFAHGFCTLTENTEVLYKVDNYYTPDHEGGIMWNDPDIDIIWPIEHPILSIKDQQNMSLKQFVNIKQALQV